MKKKTIVLMLALTLIAGAFIGSTIAWLTDNTKPVTNTFTTSDINITLVETSGADYKMVPGHTIAKDPKVTVKGGSEPAWLFVKLDKSDNFDEFMTYERADGWSQLKDDEEKEVPGVYYREVESSDIDKVFDVIKGNKVTVSDDVTKKMMGELTEEKRPTLTITAYATQLYKDANTKFTAAEAWRVIHP